MSEINSPHPYHKCPHHKAVDEDALYLILKQAGIAYERICHKPVFTVEEAQEYTAHLAGFHVKNLFLRDRKKNYFLLTLQDERAVNLKEMSKIIAAKGGLSFADEEKLWYFLGVRPGSVTPFSLINAPDENDERLVKFYLDEAIFDEAIINAHPLQNDRTIQVKTHDMKRLIGSWGYEISYI